MAMRHGLAPDHEQQLIAKHADVREANFNPNEPRDWRGRWTTGGSDDSSGGLYSVPDPVGGTPAPGVPSGAAGNPSPPTGTGGSKPPAAGGSYSPEQAKKVFDKEKARSDIAFKYPVDGCYARAHLMAEDIKKAGGDVGKVCAFAKDGADPLHANTPNDPAGYVKWKYDVAPTVPVKGADGKEAKMVIDPSLFDKPVTIQEWTGAMTPTGGGGISTSTTKIGEAPILPDGTRAPGSGYWPGPDPSRGIDTDAVERMEMYKPLEYTPSSTTVPKMR